MSYCLSPVTIKAQIIFFFYSGNNGQGFSALTSKKKTQTNKNKNKSGRNGGKSRVNSTETTSVTTPMVLPEDSVGIYSISAECCPIHLIQASYMQHGIPCNSVLFFFNCR